MKNSIFEQSQENLIAIFSSETFQYIGTFQQDEQMWASLKWKEEHVIDVPIISYDMFAEIKYSFLSDMYNTIRKHIFNVIKNYEKFNDIKALLKAKSSLPLSEDELNSLSIEELRDNKLSQVTIKCEDQVIIDKKGWKFYDVYLVSESDKIDVVINSEIENLLSENPLSSLSIECSDRVNHVCVSKCEYFYLAGSCEYVTLNDVMSVDIHENALIDLLIYYGSENFQFEKFQNILNQSNRVALKLYNKTRQMINRTVIVDEKWKLKSLSFQLDSSVNYDITFDNSSIETLHFDSRQMNTKESVVRLNMKKKPKKISGLCEDAFSDYCYLIIVGLQTKSIIDALAPFVDYEFIEDSLVQNL